MTPTEYRHTHQETPSGYHKVTATGLPCCFMVTCDRCGAVVLMRTVALHDQWHNDNNHRGGDTPMGVRP